MRSTQSPSRFFSPRGRNGRRGRSRLGESAVFLAIFLFGLTVFFFQLFTWTVPHWNAAPEYEKGVGKVVAARLLERTHHLRVEYSPEWEIAWTFAGETHSFPVTNPPDGSGETEWLADPTEAEKILGLFPVGKTIPIWISLGEPRRIRLTESPVSWGWYIQLIAFALAVFGAFGFWGTVRFRSISAERRAVRIHGTASVRTGSTASSGNAAYGSGGAAPVSGSRYQAELPAAFPTVPDFVTINDSPGTHLAYRMQTDVRPMFRMSVVLLLAALWNIASWSVFAYSLWLEGGGWFDRIVCIAFGLVFCGFGLFLLIWGFQQLLQVFGYGPTILEISDHPLYPGRRYRLHLLQSGTFRIHRFELRLVCEEIARFRQGTDTITNRKEVIRHALFARDDFEITPDQPLQHEMLLRFPPGAMHSMRCESNEIVWKIVVNAQIVGWPDLAREWVIVVRPNPLDDSMQDEEIA